MNYVSTHKSIAFSLIVSFIVASTASTMLASASAESSTSSRSASITRLALTTRLLTWAKNHSHLCFASISLPIFGMYARKTLKHLYTKYIRRPHTQVPTEQEPEAEHEIDYFDKFTDAFSKTIALVGKIFKVINIVTTPEGSSWLDNAAKL